MNIITIDGPAASGKSTIARLLSLKLDYFYLSSGYLYRGFAYYLQYHQIHYIDQIKVEELISSFFFEYNIDKEHNPYLIIEEKKLMEEELHETRIATIASIISAYPRVREVISSWQKEIVKDKNSIIDGRDCGSKVFKNVATLKFYLTASVKARAERLCHRNHLDEHDKNNLQKCEQELEARDTKDKNRLHSPLKPADDAILIDSTNLSIEETLNKIYRIINTKIK